MIAFNNDSLGKGKSPAWLFTSVDGGQTRAFVRGFDRAGKIIGISGDAKGHIVAITEWGSVLLSDNSGIAWRQGASSIAPQSWLGASHVIFSGDGVVFATWDRATFMRSTDDVESWQSTLVKRAFNEALAALEVAPLRRRAGGLPQGS